MLYDTCIVEHMISHLLRDYLRPIQIIVELLVGPYCLDIQSLESFSNDLIIIATITLASLHT